VTLQADGDLLAAFDRHRRLLFTVAYQLLGSVADAEDVVQDAWLRWSAADRADVADPKAFLVRTTSRLALDRLGSARSRRETYVGPWLPEPLLTEPGPEDAVELGEQVSLAVLVVLETLSPVERAVFVLREVFDTPYGEIADAVGRTPTAVRQIAHRAREHVAARRPRVQVSRAEQQTVVERFLAAVRSGDLEGLLEVLAPDVVVVADGGGVVAAAPRPIKGAGRVAAFLSGLGRMVGTFEAKPMWLNGGPAMRIDLDTRLDTVASLLVEDGRIARIYAIRNPEKLVRLDEEAELSR
jgi:RNA polymerase sigma-70 factor (TIGR02957 family)